LKGKMTQSLISFSFQRFTVIQLEIHQTFIFHSSSVDGAMNWVILSRWLWIFIHYPRAKKKKWEHEIRKFMNPNPFSIVISSTFFYANSINFYRLLFIFCLCPIRCAVARVATKMNFTRCTFGLIYDYSSYLP
jgi:hypothetical protein